MRNLKLIAPVTAALLLLAGAALATDFDPIADADFIGYPDDATTFTARYDTSQPGPFSDSEWGERLTADDLTVVLVAPTFDALADADFLDTTGYGAAGAEAPVYAQCAATCPMDCGSACTAHCGDACAGH